MAALSIVLATENANKVKEFKEIAGHRILFESLSELGFKVPLPEEGLISYEENASIKARFAGETLQRLCMGDDSGFEVEALGRAPGLISARWLGTHHSPSQRQEILFRLKGVFDRRARFVCSLALFSPSSKNIRYFRGEVEGEVAEVEKGENGFGYDSVFIPAGYSKTFAELDSVEKHKISHRARALEELIRSIS